MDKITPDLDPDEFISDVNDRLDTIYKILSLNYKDKSAINNLNRIIKNRLDFSKSLLPISKSIEGELLLTLPKMWMIIITLKIKKSNEQINDFLTLVNGSLTRNLIDLSDYKEYFRKQCELLLDDNKAIKMINKNPKLQRQLKFNASHTEVKNSYSYLLIRSDIFEDKLLWNISKIKKPSNIKEKNKTKKEKKEKEDKKDKEEKKDELEQKEEKSEEDSFERQYNELVKKMQQKGKQKEYSDNDNDERNDRLNEYDVIKQNKNKNKNKTKNRPKSIEYQRGKKKEKSYGKNKEKRNNIRIQNKYNNIRNKSRDIKNIAKDDKKEDDYLSRSKSHKIKNKQKTKNKSGKEEDDKEDQKKKNYPRQERSSSKNLKKIYPLTKTRKTIRNSIDPELKKGETSKSKKKRKHSKKTESTQENNVKKKNQKSKNISTKSNTIDDDEEVINLTSTEEKKKPNKKKKKKKNAEDSESEEEKINVNNSYKNFANSYTKECEFDQDAEVSAALEGFDIDFDDEILNGSDNNSELGLPADAFTSNIMDNSDLDLNFDSLV